MRYLVFLLLLCLALATAPTAAAVGAPGIAATSYPAVPAAGRIVGGPAAALLPAVVADPVAAVLARPQLTADAVLLYDPTSRQVLLERRAFAAMAPASTTKMLTCLVVLENCDPTEVVEVSSNAARTGGARVGLRTGQQLTVQELLYGLMLSSGNDAAVALAEHAGGSVEGFAVMMNDRARQLGALATNFVNPHGLSAPGHLTTAYDLAMIASAALSLPQFRELVSCREREIGSMDPSWTALMRNTNQLLWSYEGADGVKTGTTREAGQCLVASATRDGRQLIAVVLHSNNRWSDAARLLTYGFNGTVLEVAGEGGDPAVVIRVRDPVIPFGWPARLPVQVPVQAYLGATLAYAAPGPGPLSLSVGYVASPGLVLPLAAGQAIGLALAYHEGRLVASAPLLAAEAVPQGLLYAKGLELLGRIAQIYLRQGLR